MTLVSPTVSGFYSCDFFIHTVKRTRVFKDINCEERSLQSFREKK